MGKQAARNAGQGTMKMQDRQGFFIKHWDCVQNVEKTEYLRMKKHARNAGQKKYHLLKEQKNKKKGIVHQTASGIGDFQNRGFVSSAAGVKL